MAIDFPISPVLDDQFTEDGKTWYWDGEKWIFASTNPKIISAESPITYETVTQTIGINESLISVIPTQVTGTAVVDSDSRLTDSRTPVSHSGSHESGGSDELTLSQSQITSLTTDLSAKAPLASPTFTGTPLAPTATLGTNTTQIATTAFVKAETAALIDSAPATLDTLNELAAALGDDPNFATTVSTSIGEKAPLASPTFTGIPTAPTATANTNTTQIATTAFVTSETNAIQSQLSNIEAIAMLGL